MIDWQPLLALGYEAGQLDASKGRVDCLGAVLAVYRMAGVELAEADMDPSSGAWRRILSLDETRELDVLTSDPEGVGRDTHCAVIVRAGRNGTCVSASDRYGGVYAVEPWRVRGLTGIYRLQR